MTAGRIIIGCCNPTFTANGQIDAGATLTFYENGTTTPQSIFSDAGLGTPLDNPLPCDAAGLFVTVYADVTADYSVKWTRTGSTPITFNDVAAIPPAAGADTGALQKSANLSDVPSPATAWINLGGGTAGKHATADFDAAGTAAAGDVTTLAVAEAYTDAAIAALAAGKIVSADTAVSTGGTWTFTHNLGDDAVFKYQLICQTGDNGYSAGDKIIVSPGPSDTAHQGFAVTETTNTVVVKYGTGSGSKTFGYINTSGNWNSLTDSSWKMRITAIAVA